MTLALDAHCHLSDPRVFAQRRQLIENCLGQGVQWFALGGFDPDDWQRQLILKSEFSKNILCGFGLHPYFVSQATSDQLEDAFSRLEQMTGQCELLGEIGLDYRPHILKDKAGQQRSFFMRQLAVATSHDLPIVLHVVRAHEETLDILRRQPVRGLVHAFNSSWTIAEKYIDQGLLLSVGAHALRPEHQELLAKIPMEQILIESDAPDQPPLGQKSHDSITVLAIAKAIAMNKGLTSDSVLEKTRSNMEKLIRRKLST